MRLDDLVPTLLRSDPARPRITCYDDARGERIELSGKVLANWVAKAANLLQEEYDAAPGTLVRLDLPPHWRSLYWALAAWSVGATVTVTGDADVAVSTDPASLGDGPGILLTLAALARCASIPVPGDAIDEAKELATYADRFEAWERATDDASALQAGEDTAYLLDVPVGAPGLRVHTATTDLGAFLRTAIAAFATDGSLVLSIDPDPEALPARLAADGVDDTR